jgi:hypothetical protein
VKPSTPARLASLVSDCAAAGVTRQALLLRMDRLPPGLSRPHHRRLAESALAPLMRAPRSEMFHLPGPRLAVVWRGDAEAALLDVVDALEHLLADATVSAPSLRDLVFLYDLPENGDLLLQALDDSAVEVAPAGPAPAPPLDPASLLMLESSLAQADIARFARREAVWRFGQNAPALAWERRTLSLPELTAELVPDRDLAGDPWLFRRLTRTLDRRLLALLASPGELVKAGPFALDLNVVSVLGPEFLKLDATLPTTLRGSIVLALHPADVVADAAAFAFARGFARARDYRLMLRDATPQLLAVLSAAALDMDYLSVPWSTSLPGEAATLLDTCPLDSLVLECGGDPSALQWGRAAGLQLFTGSSVDRAIERTTLGEKAAAA